MGVFAELNNAGLKAIGLKPEWVDQPTSTLEALPTGAASGVFLQNCPSAIGYVAAREDVHRREGRLKIDTYDLTTTVYTVIIDGNSVVYDASVELPADNDALRAGIADAINTDGTVNVIVTASDDDANNPDSILIVGDTEADWSFDATAVGGSGAISITAAAVGFDVQLFITPGGIVKTGNTGNPNRWVAAADALWSGITSVGWAERLDVAGLDRGYLYVHNVQKFAGDGASLTATIAGIMIGPAVLEATS